MGESSISRHLRPSPNEVEAALREEKRKWRIFRMQQVREQAREEAQRILSAVRNQESHVVLSMKEDLNLKWQAAKAKQVQELQQEYQDSLQAIGRAHKLAEQQPDAEKVLAERGRHNRQVARHRGQEARKVEKEQVNQQRHEKEWLVQLRQEALNREKLRAAHVANLPMPSAFQKKKAVVEEIVPRVQYHEAGTFTTTTYVPEKIKIEKEILSTKPDARRAAVRENTVQVEKEETKKREAEEKEKKREERGEKALARERVTRLSQQLVTGLDDAQRHHHLSAYLGGMHHNVTEIEEKHVKQQREIERAVERVLQDPLPSTPSTLQPILSPDTSAGLEVIDTSTMENGGQTQSSKAAPDLASLLELMKKRKNRLMQGIYSSVSEEGTSAGEDAEEDSHQSTDEVAPVSDQGADKHEDPHITETIPVAQLSQERRGRAPITTGDSTLPTSPYTQHTPAESLNYGVVSTDYMSPPSSLPSRRVPYRDTREGSRDREQQERSESGDIHLAETVPVDRLPPHRFTRNSNASHRTPQTPTDSETFQESSSDINIKIDLSAGSGSTLKTVTPPDVNMPRPGYPLLQSYSEISSTDYLSPPSSLPGHYASIQELQEKLQRIQEQRKKNQRLLDSKFDTPQQQTSHLSSTPGSYTQKLKGEGRGQRPVKRKEKYEMQKRKLLQYYMKKLMNMRKDELENISASTVEGSGLTVSSLSSLLESLQWEGDESSVTLMPSSSEEFVRSSSDSIYTDIDQIPVKLSSLSTTSSESSKVKMSRANSRELSRESSSSGSTSTTMGTGLLPPSHFDLDPGSLSGHRSTRSKDSTQFASGLSPRLSSHSMSRYGSLDAEQQSKDRLSSEQRHQQEMTGEVSETTEMSSVFEPDPLGRLTMPLPDTSATIPDVSLTRKVSLSRSTSYQTPSREYESSLDTTSDVSVPHGHMPPVLVPSVTRPQSDALSDDHLRTLESDRKFLHHHQQLTLNYKYKRLEYKVIGETEEKWKYPEDKSNKSEINSQASFPGDIIRSLEMTNNNKGYSVPISSNKDVQLSTEKTEELSDTQMTNQNISRDQQDGSSGQIGDSSRYQSSLLAGENTTTLSLEQTQQQHVSHSSNNTSTSSRPQYSDYTSSSSHGATPISAPPESDLGRAQEERGSSESVTSIPDMGEILRRFGLDWAGSMFRKMDKAKHRASSNTSSSNPI